MEALRLDFAALLRKTDELAKRLARLTKAAYGIPISLPPAAKAKPESDRGSLD